LGLRVAGWPRGPGLSAEEYTFTRKVDIRLPGKGNSKSHGARPVHLIITMIKWIRTSRLSMKNSLSLGLRVEGWPRGPGLAEEATHGSAALDAFSSGKGNSKLPWCEAGPPDHHDDKVDSDQ